MLAGAFLATPAVPGGLGWPGRLVGPVALILLALVLPLSVGGWGLREGAAATLLPVAGATAAEGLAASIAFGPVFLAALAADPTPPPGVTCAGLAKTRAGGGEAVRPLDLDFAARQTIGPIGPSGCGKSTILRMIAGIEAPSAVASGRARRR